MNWIRTLEGTWCTKEGAHSSSQHVRTPPRAKNPTELAVAGSEQKSTKPVSWRRDRLARQDLTTVTSGAGVRAGVGAGTRAVVGNKPLSWTARRASKSADSLLRALSSLRSICCVKAFHIASVRQPLSRVELCPTNRALRTRGQASRHVPVVNTLMAVAGRSRRKPLATPRTQPFLLLIETKCREDRALRVDRRARQKGPQQCSLMTRPLVPELFPRVRRPARSRETGELVLHDLCHQLHRLNQLHPPLRTRGGDLRGRCQSCQAQLVDSQPGFHRQNLEHPQHLVVAHPVGPWLGRLVLAKDTSQRCHGPRTWRSTPGLHSRSSTGQPGGEACCELSISPHSS